jgi:hypothetical protein
MIYPMSSKYYCSLTKPNAAELFAAQARQGRARPQDILGLYY